MEKTRMVKEEYTVCDWCDREITEHDKELHWITGDFPSIVLHKEPCVRQAIAHGIAHKTRPTLTN